MTMVSGSKLAELTGFAWRTVKRRLIAAGVQPVEKRGSADLYDSKAALLALYGSTTGAPDIEDQRQRLAAAQAEKVEHENAVRRGELARKEDVIAFWSECIVNARAKLLALPSRIAADVPGDLKATVHERAKRIIYEALTELSEYEGPATTTAQGAQHR